MAAFPQARGATRDRLKAGLPFATLSCDAGALHRSRVGPEKRKSLQAQRECRAPTTPTATRPTSNSARLDASGTAATSPGRTGKA